MTNNFNEFDKLVKELEFNSSTEELLESKKWARDFIQNKLTLEFKTLFENWYVHPTTGNEQQLKSFYDEFIR